MSNTINMKDYPKSADEIKSLTKTLPRIERAKVFFPVSNAEVSVQATSDMGDNISEESRGHVTKLLKRELDKAENIIKGR